MKISRYHNFQSGFVLLGSIFLALFLSILIGVVLTRSQVELKETDVKVDSHQSFYAAESGIEQAIFKLRTEASWGIKEAQTDPAKPQYVEKDMLIEAVDEKGNKYPIGTYSIQISNRFIQNGWENVWILATGVDQYKKIKRTIRAKVIVANPARFMTLTLSDLVLQSGAKLDDDVLGRNIYFDIIGDGDININGDVYYLNKVFGDKDPKDPSLSNPKVKFSGKNAQGDPHGIKKSKAITFPGVDFEKAKADVILAEKAGIGIFNNSSSPYDINLGDAKLKDIKLIVSKGDVHVSGKYDHSMTVIAGGDIIIKGDIKSEGVKPQLGLLADKDVIIPKDVGKSSLDVEAFVMADGEGDAKGIFEAEGGAGSKGSLKFLGAIAVRGNEDAAGDTAVNMNAFLNRDYKYNEELASNNTLPFLPLIANVVEWQEVLPPQDVFPPNPLDQ